MYSIPIFIFESGTGFEPVNDGLQPTTLTTWLTRPLFFNSQDVKEQKKPDLLGSGSTISLYFLYEKDFPTIVFLPLINEQNIPIPMRLDVDM